MRHQTWGDNNIMIQWQGKFGIQDMGQWLRQQCQCNPTQHQHQLHQQQHQQQQHQQLHPWCQHNTNSYPATLFTSQATPVMTMNPPAPASPPPPCGPSEHVMNSAPAAVKAKPAEPTAPDTSTAPTPAKALTPTPPSCPPPDPNAHRKRAFSCSQGRAQKSFGGILRIATRTPAPRVKPCKWASGLPDWVCSFYAQVTGPPQWAICIQHSVGRIEKLSKSIKNKQNWQNCLGKD